MIADINPTPTLSHFIFFLYLSTSVCTECQILIKKYTLYTFNGYLILLPLANVEENSKLEEEDWEDLNNSRYAMVEVVLNEERICDQITLLLSEYANTTGIVYDISYRQMTLNQRRRKKQLTNKSEVEEDNYEEESFVSHIGELVDLV